MSVDTKQIELLEPLSMLYELESNWLEVVLVPAPDPRHSGHCVRKAHSYNADWYRKFCRWYPSGSKRKCGTRKTENSLLKDTNLKDFLLKLKDLVCGNKICCLSKKPLKLPRNRNYFDARIFI